MSREGPGGSIRSCLDGKNMQTVQRTKRFGRQEGLQKRQVPARSLRPVVSYHPVSMCQGDVTADRAV